MKRLFALSLLSLFLLPSCDTLQQIVDTASDTPLTTAEVARGLKQALEIGVSDGADKLSSLDGYFESPYKILLPEETQKVVDRLKVVPGFGDLEEKLTLRLNRAAEDAAKKAKPIFVDAITSMTFDDAMDILLGSNDAATNYLQRKTMNALVAEFQPVILNSLEEVYAQQLWSEASTAYNKIPFVNKVDTQLDRHVTDKALVGMFGMVEQKEQAIRTDVSERTNDLLRKVFAKQD